MEISVDDLLRMLGSAHAEIQWLKGAIQNHRCPPCEREHVEKDMEKQGGD